VLVLVLTVGAGLASAQGAGAKTVTVSCSTLQGALNSAGTHEIVRLNGLCVDKSFTITNTHEFTLEGVGDSKSGTPDSGFNGIAGATASVLSSFAGVRMTIKNLLFENADTDFGGAAISFTDNDQIAVTITGDTFRNNAAQTEGGAIEITDNAPGNGVHTPTVISHDRFKDNRGADGGALFWADGSPLELRHDTFLGNAQDSTTNVHPEGGAVDIENYAGAPWLGSPITISHNTFGGIKAGDGNTALGSGGALYISVQGGEGAGEPAQTVTLTRNDFYENGLTGGVNFDSFGGGLAMNPQPQEFGFRAIQQGNIFDLNQIAGTMNSGFDAGGGGEWVRGVSVTSTGDGFFENTVDAATSNLVVPPLGGGLGVLSTNQTIGTAPTKTLLRASFTGADDLFDDNMNTSPGGWGGGIYTGGSLLGCISEAACPSRLSLINSTIARNRASKGAGIWGGPGDSLTLENSIVYGNGPSGRAEIFGYSHPTYSFDDACTLAHGTTPLAGTEDICVNAKLTVVGQETSASPTIDRGSNALVPSGLNLDLFGGPRITEGHPRTCQATVDMGAFESAAVKPASDCGPEPVDVIAPRITGQAAPGHTLTCAHGTWSHSPTSFLYRWKRDGQPIPGSTGATDRVVAADRGQTLTCTVRAVNRRGTRKPATAPGVVVSSETA
jgi:hypothetical protein